MILRLKGDYLERELFVIIDNEQKVLRKNKTIEFELETNKSYQVIIKTGLKEKNMVDKLMRILLKHPKNKGYLFWYEDIDAIEIQNSFKICLQQDQLIKVQYAPSFYREETSSWYLPKITIDYDVDSEIQYFICNDELAITYYQIVATYINVTHLFGLIVLNTIFPIQNDQINDTILFVLIICFAMIVADIIIIASIRSKIKLLKEKLMNEIH